jgi:hypothetical protein
MFPMFEMCILYALLISYRIKHKQPAITWRLFTGCSRREDYCHTDNTEIPAQNLIQLYTIPFTCFILLA